MTPRRLAWLAMTLGAVVAAVLRGGFDAPHGLALAVGLAVAGVVGLAVSAELYTAGRE